MKEKLNNYHFGRHVFEYFPWYKYSKDLTVLPTVDENTRNTFTFAFDDYFSHIYSFWFDNVGIFRNNTRSDYGVSVYGNTISYNGISETIFDWEDIEKVRLRILLGKEDEANQYMKVIDFYNEYKYKILDAIYIDSNIDEFISIVDLSDFINRDCYEFFSSLIKDEDVIESMYNGKYNKNSFTNSVHRYLIEKGHLSKKQIDAVKRISHKEILTGRKMTFISVKTNRIKNLNRIVTYFESLNLRTVIFDETLIIFK